MPGRHKAQGPEQSASREQEDQNDIKNDQGEQEKFHVETAEHAAADDITGGGPEDDLADYGQGVAERSYAAIRGARYAAEDQMSARPWITLLAGGAIGFLAALLISSRR